MSQTNRLSNGGRIDRNKVLTFTFNGQTYKGFEGDTLAAALLANGVDIIGRSFKYSRPRGIFAAGAEEPNAVLLCALVVAHFVKREYETLFVHRFSAATMPARNLAKNSAHYWLLSGVNLAYWLYAPGARVSAPWWPGALEPATHAAVRHAAVALFVFAQASNYATHVTLRNLRPDGSTKRQIPRGYGFGLVTCPNYMFEALAWHAHCALQIFRAAMAST